MPWSNEKKIRTHRAFPLKKEFVEALNEEKSLSNWGEE